MTSIRPAPSLLHTHSRPPNASETTPPSDPSKTKQLKVHIFPVFVPTVETCSEAQHNAKSSTCPDAYRAATLRQVKVLLAPTAPQVFSVHRMEVQLKHVHPSCVSDGNGSMRGFGRIMHVMRVWVRRMRGVEMARQGGFRRGREIL